MILHSFVFLYTTANLQGSKGSVLLGMHEKVGRELFKAASATGSGTGPRDGIPQPLWASALVWVPPQWKAFSLPQIWISCIVAHVWCLSSFCHVTLKMSLAQPVLHLLIRHSSKCPWSLSAISHLSFNPARISPISLDGNYGREGQRPCWSQVGDITCSPLSHTASQPMREGNPEGQAHLAHGNSMLAVTNHLLNLCVWKLFPAGSTTKLSLEPLSCPSWSWDQCLPLSCHCEPLWSWQWVASQWPLSPSLVQPAWSIRPGGVQLAKNHPSWSFSTVGNSLLPQALPLGSEAELRAECNRKNRKTQKKLR